MGRLAQFWGIPESVRRFPCPAHSQALPERDRSAAARLVRADDPARVTAFAKDVEAIGKTLFMPASILVLVFGVAMVWYAPAWELTDLWVILGLVGIANTIVVGSVFLGPEAGRIGRLGEERGSDDPDVQRRIARIFKISRYDLTVLFLVVADMVLKPGT